MLYMKMKTENPILPSILHCKHSVTSSYTDSSHCILAFRPSVLVQKSTPTQAENMTCPCWPPDELACEFSTNRFDIKIPTYSKTKITQIKISNVGFSVRAKICPISYISRVPTCPCQQANIPPPSCFASMLATPRYAPSLYERRHGRNCALAFSCVRLQWKRTQNHIVQSSGSSIFSNKRNGLLPSY